MLWRALLFGLVFVSPPFLKAWLLRRAGARIDNGAVIGWFSAVAARRVELGARAAIKPFTLIFLDGDLAIGAYSEVSSFTLVYGSSDFVVGAESYIGPQSLINVEEPVRIGSGSALGPRAMVFTHGSYLPYIEGYWVRMAGVTVGDKVWCAAGVFLHPGVEIGDDSFVNSCAVVTQSLPPGSVAEGNPARVVYPMARVKRKMGPRQVDLALERTLVDFAEVGLRRQLRIETIERTQGCLRFAYRDRRYCVLLVGSDGRLPQQPAAMEQAVVLVNAENPPLPANALIMDVPKRVAALSPDPIHTALRLFLLRYFGVRFREESAD